MQNFDLLIERIARVSGLGKEEIERRVEAKRAKLSGLISKEGAAQIIAAELGISFENVQLKISELMPGMRKISVFGKIINLFAVREYNKNGRSGKIGSFIIADESGNVRAVLWDANHIKLIESGHLKQGDVVEIANASMREGEIHLGGFSDIKKSELVLENVKTETVLQERAVKDLDAGQRVKVRGVIVQMFNPRFFHVCPECGKKATEGAEGFSCEEHGRVSAKERCLINGVLDDGTETIRFVLFSDQINKLIPEEELKNPEKLITFREDLLGSGVYISGIVKKNTLFNNLEVSVSDIERVDVEKLIEQLEKN